ncbi:hypothetical protein K505DRAFT_343185 [Melanomma pulvis-pyrius CBS 109.77]|uniref:Uncharacterized protein n=1 Tax=Melanomma pulvis-pyrius CBS 109.77 TaxID=1314802 RepID=A0A6A6WTM6_9PLEO|nr:hypothetical protein K505DRAFT_343185 [Melanomma pulvis-pyrius CBS 109.77]
MRSILEFGSAALLFTLLAPATARTVAKVTVEIDINEGIANSHEASGSYDLLSDTTQSIIVAGANKNRQHPIEIEIEEEVDAGNNVTAALANVPASVTCLSGTVIPKSFIDKAILRILGDSTVTPNIPAICPYGGNPPTPTACACKAIQDTTSPDPKDQYFPGDFKNLEPVFKDAAGEKLKNLIYFPLLKANKPLGGGAWPEKQFGCSGSYSPGTWRIVLRKPVTGAITWVGVMEHPTNCPTGFKNCFKPCV